MPETLVIDCSVVAKWILPESGRESALRILDRYQSGDAILIAPDLLVAEFAGLLSKRCRRREMSGAQAGDAFELILRSAPRMFQMRPLLPRALNLSITHGLSLWDCVYIALAEAHQSRFVTADRRLFRGGKGRHQCLHLLS